MVGLIKWPAFLVKGAKVTERQAAEILIKTDSHLPNFEYAGNDHAHGERLTALFGIPKEYDDGIPYDKKTKKQIEKSDEERRIRWESMERLEQELGRLQLNYLHNDQIVSSYIGGPHGWCDWQGNIGCSSTNIGKWPSVEEVTREWEAIAKAFPFLDLECQLCNHEAGYPQEGQVNGPVVKFFVKKGGVVVIEQDPSKDTYTVAPRDDMSHFLARMVGGRGSEQGISFTDLVKKLNLVYDNEIPQYERVEPEKPKKKAKA